MRIKRVLIGSILLALAILPNCGYMKSVPGELIGIWKTEAPEYAGLFVALNEKSIALGRKDGTVNTFNITRVKKKKMNKEWSQYTICYFDRKMKKWEFSILYYPHNEGIIKLVNKKQITWTKHTALIDRKGDPK